MKQIDMVYWTAGRLLRTRLDEIIATKEGKKLPEQMAWQETVDAFAQYGVSLEEVKNDIAPLAVDLVNDYASEFARLINEQ